MEKDKRKETVEQGRATFNREGRKEKEYWQCGTKGYFRYECPVDVTKQK